MNPSLFDYCVGHGEYFDNHNMENEYHWISFNLARSAQIIITV